MRWNPGTYARYAGHRGRPFLDLLSRIDAEAPRTVVDLGCGPGELTEILARRWPGAEVTGIDSSEDMIAAARRRQVPANLRFASGDVRDHRTDGVDVIVSNAVLQWVPGHQDLLAGGARSLDPDGWVAVQVPGNFGAPSHALLREHAASPRWAAKLDGVLRHEDAVGEPTDYLQVLLSAGLEADVWETTYQQVLEGEDAVLEWVRGTALRPVLTALSAEDGRDFETGYAELLRAAYPRTGHGTVLGFRRIFAVGHRSA
ncbi:trans-aconitate methyltransferase [Arthrobacter sp. RIT-PI-e]|uniref:trans-aconitate 2-methyltransferase n=1 Tax=Arthrobacter sp. RIT-PI-e TaxID=1681197 RepID=UPI00067639BA|nr:trans-aconitate 2-methyltransferase [Arthrobacter sp. RIT-PI-e]KNC18882.1 trans-aconitate methyltransferase [Arthrobacter sp. RIT-PI-e]